MYSWAALLSGDRRARSCPPSRGPTAAVRQRRGKNSTESCPRQVRAPLGRGIGGQTHGTERMKPGRMARLEAHIKGLVKWWPPSSPGRLDSRPLGWGFCKANTLVHRPIAQKWLVFAFSPGAGINKEKPRNRLVPGFPLGSGRRIRTLTYRVRVCCATLTQSRYFVVPAVCRAAGPASDGIYYIKLSRNVNPFFQISPKNFLGRKWVGNPP